jgi:hypothetical protein
MRFPLVVCVFVCVAISTIPLLAQSPNGNINGLVSDPSSAAVTGAEIVAVNDVTGVQYTAKSDDEGIYVLPNLPPGPYRLQVSKIGFKTLIKPDIIVNVQDSLSINFTLLVGALHEIVTVEGGAPLVNTESAAVSTVVDRKYVENMPLNGRSFQDLVLLTPGVVTNNPQSTPTGTGLGINGEFSVNGQRTESNYYMVDGVSANVGVSAGNVNQPSTGGGLPAATALGTTQGLVSVDALQEFRVQSSTYSAEYGRNPGGQFSFVTRSGMNQWHATAFDYLRNNVFDANDWFNDHYNKPEPPLRQNDFGGILGGPVEVPFLYSGKDKTFFFLSYEGLRLDQPQAASINYVPDNALRQSAPGPLQPVLNAFPVQNGPEVGNGLAEFIGTWSNPSQIDATSVRLDHSLGGKLRLFFRFGDTSSSAQSRGTGNSFTPSVVQSTAFTNRIYTLGATSLISPHVNNEFRLNYSSNDSVISQRITDFGDGTAVDLAQLQELNLGSNPAYDVSINLFFPGYGPALNQVRAEGVQRQWNLVDTLSVGAGRHELKFGVDYRRLSPIQRSENPIVAYYYLSQSSLKANNADFALGETFVTAYPSYTNFSAFAQDEWRLTSSLNLSLGLRWDVNPAPGATNVGNLPYAVEGSTLSTLRLAPQGTPLWQTSWFNFAPRLGVSYTLPSTPGWETVLRTGGGLFFDTGQQDAGSAWFNPGFTAFNFFGGSFPAPSSKAVPPIINPPVPPYGTTYAFPRHFQLPFTLQWNAALQQALGKSQALTVSYVGANGRRLLELNDVNVAAANSSFTYIDFINNGLTSDYHALQVQFQRRLASGLQALASYTWGHSIDYNSQNQSYGPYFRGNSDFDIRNNFSAALSYDLPSVLRGRAATALLHDWGLDSRVSARTGFPVTLFGSAFFDPATGKYLYEGLSVVPNQPDYLYSSQYPGGRSVNPAAFTAPPSGILGSAPRNFINGFGAWQVDFAVRREFPVYERLKLQFRAEAFNIFNHPNFGTINSNYCSPGPGCTFGQATATLANSLGVLSPLYQMGGARSLQFALKLIL